MLITLTASLPKAIKTTTITPRMFLPMPIQRLWRDGKPARHQKSLVEIGEVQPVFIKIGEPIRFVPYDFHGIFCIYILI